MGSALPPDRALRCGAQAGRQQDPANGLDAWGQSDSPGTMAMDLNRVAQFLLSPPPDMAGGGPGVTRLRN